MRSMLWLETAALLVGGILRRFYFWVPSFLLDPFDFYDKYAKPHTRVAIDIPEWLFPYALGLGVILAAIGTASDLRMRGRNAAVRFEVRGQDASVPIFDGSREDTPCDQVELRWVGALNNAGSERVPIDGVGVRVWQRWRLVPIWQRLQDPTTITLRGALGNNVDPYYQGVHVDGGTRSRDISEVHAFVKLPTGVKNRPHFRTELQVKTAMMHNYGATRTTFDLTDAIERGEAEHARIHEFFDTPPQHQTAR